MQSGNNASLDIVMPVRNGAETIEEAVNSLLAQSMRDFALYIIDDGSTDQTSQIATAIGRYDKRVQLHRNPGAGIVDALNFGCRLGHAPLIARMDADDIALPSRFAKQSSEFSKRDDLVLLGTAISIFGRRQANPPVVMGDNKCRSALRLFSPFCHPTVMLRRSAFERAGGYTNRYPHAEDYDLFCRISAYGEIDNINEVLLNYREHNGQISVLKRHDQKISSFKISSENLKTKNLPKLLMHKFVSAIKIGPQHLRSSLRNLRDTAVIGKMSE